jgi:sulfate transport system permease protein
MPGFAPAMGFTIFYLSATLLIPLAALVARPWEHGWAAFWATVSDPRVLAALRLSFGIAFAAAAVNSVMGVVVAWVLVRYDFPGRRFAAMPTLSFGALIVINVIQLTLARRGAR